MLIGTSSAHFPYLRNKGGSQWRQLRPEWQPQHRSGKNSQEVATPTCCEACKPCDLLWKLTFTKKQGKITTTGGHIARVKINKKDLTEFQRQKTKAAQRQKDNQTGKTTEAQPAEKTQYS